MAEHDERMKLLESQLADTRQELAALRTQLDQARNRTSMTMRAQTRCPGCGGTKILHSTKAVDSGNPGNALCLHTPVKIFRGFIPTGAFEVYVCMSCRLAEWYVTSLDDVKLDLEQFRIIEGESGDGAGPYR